VNAFFEERVRGARSEPGITEHNGNDRVVPRHKIEAQPGQRLAKVLRVPMYALSHRATLFATQKFERLECRCGDARWHSVGKKIRARALTQQLDDFLSARSIASRRTAERLAQRAGDNVHVGFDTAIFR